MASNGIRMSLVGGKEAEATLQKVKNLLNSEAVQDVLMPGAEMVRDIAKRLVNIGPGRRKDGSPRRHLRDLIFATKGKRRMKGLMAAVSDALDGGGPSVIAGVDLKQAPHAHLVEFKHRIVGHKPKKLDTGKEAEGHPFIRPAATAARPFIVASVSNGLKRLLAPFE